MSGKSRKQIREYMASVKTREVKPQEIVNEMIDNLRHNVAEQKKKATEIAPIRTKAKGVSDAG